MQRLSSEHNVRLEMTMQALSLEDTPITVTTLMHAHHNPQRCDITST